MAAKIVIKIKDTFFLQEVTFVANPTKLLIGNSFFDVINFDRVRELYPVLKNAGNIAESEMVFTNLIASLNTIAPGVKLESLFSVIEATSAVNLMQMAKDRSGHIGENLLNFYLIEIEKLDVEKVLDSLNKLANVPNLGIDYIYLRGELASYDTSFPPIEDLSATSVIDRNERTKFLDTKVKLTPKQVFVEPQKTIPQDNSKSSQVTATTISIINGLFNSYGVSGLAPSKSPNVQVVDLEQGFDFTKISPLGFTTLLYGVSSSNTDKVAHGTNTIRVLGGVPSTTVLGGLSKNAKIMPATTFFGTSTNDKREAALTDIVANKSTVLRIGDIILLEIEIVGIFGNPSNFPVEVEPGYFNVIKNVIASKFIVIEAAGNGKMDLTTVTSSSPIFNKIKYQPLRNTADGTGAIMVGAIKRSSSAFVRHTDSNYGGRIDCYCIGEDTKTSTTTTYNNTSLASAIIAALVANMQMKAINKGTRMSIANILNFLTPTSSLTTPYLLPNKGSQFIASYP